MKKSLQIRKNETLAAWCLRLSQYLVNRKVSEEELCDVLHNLSVTSYIHGSNDALNVIKK